VLVAAAVAVPPPRRLPLPHSGRRRLRHRHARRLAGLPAGPLPRPGRRPPRRGPGPGASHRRPPRRRHPCLLRLA
jgi:hypothetical protein